MSHGDRRMRRLLVVACALVGGIAMAGDCASPGADSSPRIVVKFVDGLVVGAEGKTLRVEAPSDPAVRSALAQRGIDDAKLSAERAEIGRLLARSDVSHAAPLFSDDARGLQADGKTGERDLRLYVSVVLRRGASEMEIEELTRRLDALEVVETAYRAPVGEDAGIAKPDAE